LTRMAGSFSSDRKVSGTATLVTGAAVAFALNWFCGFSSVAGSLAFWITALAIVSLVPFRAHQPLAIESPARRQLLTSVARAGLPIVMGGGVLAVAAESFLRDQVLAERAIQPTNLFPFSSPIDRPSFGGGLVRTDVTPVREFYGMSKDSVDPVIDPRTWRLNITVEGRTIRRFTYGDLLAMQRQNRYVTLRCISNTLQSDLMGTAAWAGVHLSQLVERNAVPPDIVEVAFIGTEGHDDSVKLDYAYIDETLLALGMNGKTLSRTHGFPVRLLAPRYYGCRNVKWIGEIRFVSKSYLGTWQRLGYTNEPIIHTASHIDHMRRDGPILQFGGVSFAGSRGIRAVRVRANDGPWEPARLEPALSPYTWTRWVAQLRAPEGAKIEANAQDGCGAWQELSAGNPFPNGPSGPTIVIARV
jgi:DMSO/TMAO reductase YedYZ molybdopterin-dependent catalytic subunit